MYPTVFGGVQAYTVCLVLADLIGLAVAFVCAHRARVPLRHLAAPLVVLTVAAFTGAKLYGLIERGGAVGAAQAELVSGYRYPGAVIALTLAAMLLSRLPRVGISTGKMMDLITASFAFALVVVRVGCFLAGCCAGTVSSVPWAIQFPSRSQVWFAHLNAALIDATAPHSLAVHPLQLYFGALSLVLGLCCLWLEPRKHYDGQVFLVFVATYGAGQFLLEFLRARPLPHVQYLCGALALVAVTILLRRSAAAKPSGVARRYGVKEVRA